MKQFIKRLNLVDWIFYIYFIYLSLLTIFAWSRVPYNSYLLFGNISFFIFLTLLIHYTKQDSHKFLKFIRYFYSLMLMTFVYKETEFYMQVFHNTWLDPLITGLEYRIFGVYPTLWMEKIVSRPLTEFFKMSYSLYFIILPSIPLYLFLKKNMQAFYHYLFVLMLGIFIGYVGFMIFPVQGPRYYWGDFAFPGRKYPFPFLRNSMGYTYEIKELTGYIFTRIIDNMMQRGDSTGACIPSVHNAVAVIGLYGIWRYIKKLRIPGLILVICICMATVYNRYHYVADMVTGIIAGLLAILAGNIVFKTGREYIKDS